MIRAQALESSTFSRPQWWRGRCQSHNIQISGSLNSLLSTINTVNTAFLTNTASFVSAPSGASANQQTGGVWGRTVAGYVDTKATSTSEFSLAPATTGTGTCAGTIHEEYVGSQFGFDLGKLNLGSTGANFHFGVTGSC